METKQSLTSQVKLAEEQQAKAEALEKAAKEL
jgi:hypothetical protein